MRPKDRGRGAALKAALVSFDSGIGPLPGIHPPGHLDCLVAQLIDSLRRIEFIHTIRDGRHARSRLDPTSPMFDPLKAAVLQYRAGDVDEAFWLIFIATHFGKHGKDGWRLARDVYGQLGGPGLWDWRSVSANPAAFRTWLAARQQAFKGGNVRRRFSNHRKYESLSATSAKGTASVFESYVNWVGPSRSHLQLIREAQNAVGQHPEAVFDYLYRSMSAVRRFGRLAKFDHLTMLSKLGFAPVVAGSAYLGDATGPLKGARLLFDGSPNSRTSGRKLDAALDDLDKVIGLGKQALEDGLCNWQKSPAKFVHFTG